MRIQHAVHRTCTHVCALTAVTGKPSVHSTLVAVKFPGNQKLRVDFQVRGASAPLTPMLFKVTCIYFPRDNF